MKAHPWTPARVVKVWLDVVWVLGCVAAGLLALYLLASSLSGPVGRGADATVTVAIGAHSFLPRMPLELAAAPAPDISNVHSAALVRGYGELRATTQSRLQPLVSLLLIELFLLVVLYALWTLRAVVASVLAGRPFAPANSRRLQRIGFVILGVTVLFPIPEYLIGEAILREMSVVGLTLSPAFRFSTDGVLTGLLFLVLAAIFRHGSELERERALTV